MSYHVFFSMSTGLSKNVRVPLGSKAKIWEHIAEVEHTLGIKRTKYEDNPVHWDWHDAAWRAGFPDVTDKALCETVLEHNNWVRDWYKRFAYWAEHPFRQRAKPDRQGPYFCHQPAGTKAETVTPKQSAAFWFGFQQLEVNPDRWTADFYRNRMEHLYEVMRGLESEGVSFGEKALTPRQAAQVVNIFSTYLNDHDLRLDVPKDRDYLASSYDGGYSWCEKCGAVAEDDWDLCKKRKCPLREEELS